MNTRLFVAIALPPEVNDELDLLETGMPGARWSPPERRHITLRFIGEVDGLVFQDVCQALERVDFEPFSLSLRGVGSFPPRGAPRSLWAGTSESEELHALHRRVDRVLVEAGLEPERRKYRPHVTLARLSATPSSHVAAFLAGHALYGCSPFEISSFQLYSSRLYSHGPEYALEMTYEPG